ncbi:alpha/beta hydrolase [Paenibacillus sp. UNC451MF]|uniref:alpha/beta hydrolase n=1 Tax=Paenibacillus sp. UNC451MF TaxID=1449063 RepID=UPI00048E89C6|nr:alpha/beta hydrolase [Paenibacillus sp. UNC451MF]
MKQILNEPYSSSNHELQKMDLFIPGDNANGVGLFFIHGGGWKSGNRKHWHPVAAYFCAKGYTCVSVGYRLAPRSVYPSQIEDVRLAMSVFMERAGQYRFDPSRIAAVGSSAGGHLAALLGTINAGDKLGWTPEMPILDTRPNTLILYYAATNLHPKDNYDNTKELIAGLFGRSDEEAAGVYESASPVDRINGSELNALLIHGDEDHIIPLEHSIQFRDKLLDQGGEAELVVLSSVKHGIKHSIGSGVTTSAQAEALQAADRFLTDQFF